MNFFLLFITVALSQWKSTGVLQNPEDKQIKLTFAVRQQNVDKLEELLMDVSNPHSGNYGRHWSFEAINNLVRPKQRSIDAVVTFLEGLEIRQMTSNSDFIETVVSVAKASELLSGVYHEFEHELTGSKVWRINGTWSMPTELVPHVDFIAPTTNFPPSLTAKVDRSLSEGENDPDTLRKLYNFTSADIGKSDPTNIQAVASFLEQYYSKTDLVKFWSKYGVQQSDVFDVPTTQKHGNGVEAELDVQYITAMGQSINTQMWYTRGRAPTNPENEPFIEFLTSVENADNSTRPSIFSISYGDEESGVGDSYAVRVCSEFAKLGAAGISVLVASGDSGVGCSMTGFSPTFPASCPWVTGVGGTVGGSGRWDTGESAAGLSGGGFSNIFDRPDYQKAAVEQYLTEASLPRKRYWNQTSRGFPDVSAQCEGFVIISEGSVMPDVAGTSAACPTFAGTIALLNQQCRDKGGKNLGFLNPMLYDMSKVGGIVNDVTEGENNYCDGAGGFTASERVGIRRLELVLPIMGACVIT